MIKKIEKYVCPYCKWEHNSEKETEKCLSEHNIVFEIIKNIGGHDCWGNYESNWVSTGYIFKNYADAKPYQSDPNLDIRIMELRWTFED